MERGKADDGNGSEQVHPTTTGQEGENSPLPVAWKETDEAL